MKKMSLFLSIIVLFSSIYYLFSETAEDRFLKKREQRIMTYTYQSKSGSMQQKLYVLDSILNEFATEKYTTEDKNLLDLIIFLSEEGTTRQVYENNRLINDFPEVRRKACILLGKLGGDEARNALINILSNDPNQSVKAEACNALAEIGDNESGEALRAIVFAYRRTYKPDQNFAMAIINAVTKIAKVNTGAFGDAILILSEIQMGQYSTYIRDAAYKAIKELNESNQ